jgi:hypothetical protein
VSSCSGYMQPIGKIRLTLLTVKGRGPFRTHAVCAGFPRTYPLLLECTLQDSNLWPAASHAAALTRLS